MRRQVFACVVAGALAVMGSAGSLAQEGTPAAGGLLAGLGYPELVITATDEGFTLDQTEIPAGRYLVTLANESSNPQVLSGLVQLPEGKTLDDLSLADEAAAGATPDMSQGPSPEMMAATDWLYQTYIAGGPSSVNDVSNQAVVNLPAGSYGVWYEDPFAMLPVPGLTVTGDPEAAIEGPEPEAAVTIVETGEGGVGYSFDVQGDFVAGPQIVKILNASDQPHFVDASQYPEPVTIDQVMDAFTFDPSTGATPPPDMIDFAQVTYVGYAGAQSIGTTQWVVMSPEYSQVLLACFVPDPLTEGTPHAFEGMLQVFDVAG
jgi:hypothetical protein